MIINETLTLWFILVSYLSMKLVGNARWIVLAALVLLTLVARFAGLLRFV